MNNWLNNLIVVNLSIIVEKCTKMATCIEPKIGNRTYSQSVKTDLIRKGKSRQ